MCAGKNHNYNIALSHNRLDHSRSKNIFTFAERESKKVYQSMTVHTFFYIRRCSKIHVIYKFGCFTSEMDEISPICL